jgi:PAS domain S-box-containing protein
MAADAGAREDAVLRLAAQHAVARTLVEAETVEDAAVGVLSAIAGALGCEVAALWEIPAGGSYLRFVAGWEAHDGDTEAFWRATRELRFAPGEGLPGRAWASARVERSIDLRADPQFLRAEEADLADLRAGLAIPAPVGRAQDVVAVMEFFAADFREPDSALNAMLVAFGDQLAQFVRRRRAEHAVRESDALKSAILASALDCLITIDHRGLVREFNPAAEQTFGYSREETIGRDLADLVIPPDLRPRHREGMRRFLETGHGPILDRRVEIQGMRADGTRIPVELTVTQIPGTSPPLFTGFLRDITARRRAERDQRRLAAIVEGTEDAVLSLDLDGFIRSWNPGAERLYGHSSDRMVGRHLDSIVPEDKQPEMREIIAAVARGETFEGFETERVRADGARIDVALTISPLVDGAEGVIGASVIARDITERMRADHAREFLAAASAALDASLDPATTLRTITETAIPDLAELCVIDLLDQDGEIGEAVAAAVDPGTARRLEEIRRAYPLRIAGRHPVAQVLRTRRPLVIRDLATPDVEEQVAQSDEHRNFMRDAGYNSAAVVPMLARGRMLGALSLLHVRNDRRYDRADLELLQDLASRAAMALDNARLYAERAHVAQTLQRSLLPSVLPELPGAEVAARYRAAGEGNEVGGDFYDVFETGGGWAMLVGDVCGKGAEAASLTALIRYSLRALTLQEPDPRRALEQINETMLREDLSERFATAILAWIDLSRPRARMLVANAGHPAGIVLRADGSGARCVPTDRGSLLGVVEEPAIACEELTLEPGETLVLYTDGLLEAGAPARVLGPSDVADELTGGGALSPAAVVERLDCLALSLAPGRLRDDLAMMAVRVG